MAQDDRLDETTDDGTGSSGSSEAPAGPDYGAFEGGGSRAALPEQHLPPAQNLGDLTGNRVQAPFSQSPVAPESTVPGTDGPPAGQGPWPPAQGPAQGQWPPAQGHWPPAAPWPPAQGLAQGPWPAQGPAQGHWPPAQGLAQGHWPPAQGLAQGPWPAQGPAQGHWPPAQGPAQGQWPPAAPWPTAQGPAQGPWPAQGQMLVYPQYPPVQTWPGPLPAWPQVPHAGVPWVLPVAQDGPAPGVVWASMGLRFGALIIDAVVMFGAFFVAAVLAAALSPGFADRVDGRTEYSTAGAAVLGAWVVFFFLYHPVSWWRFGCTIGQRAMGMRVVRALDGRRLHLGAVVLRYVVWFACMLPLGILAIIAAIVASNEPAKRAWHDEASGSVVIKTYG